MIGEAEMNIFVRYADIAGYPPMPYRVRAYDCRFFFTLSGSGKIDIDGTDTASPRTPSVITRQAAPTR